MTGVPFHDFAAAHSELAAELDAAFRRVLASGRYVRGPEVERFEHDFARYCAVAGAAGVGNGLDALMLTLEAMGIGGGDEVIVSAHTSIATWLAITHAGARPVPIEPEPATMLIDPARVESAVGPRTAAIIAVHLYGMPADMDALAEIAGRRGLRVIEDASQAHGARLRDRPVGSLSDAAAFSLYPTKNLGAIGDAGIVVSDDPELLERVGMLANYGERERHRSELRGRNSRLDELQAALLGVKLARLDDENAHRRARAQQYRSALSGCPGLALPGVVEDALPVWHQFVVRVADRDRVRAELARRGVETLIHYPIPPHRSPAYASDYPDPLPLTEELAATVLSLPISPQLSEASCALVCEALLDTVAA
ncbi:MAG TPA: DegT/DnrJ/EryC1/StrS family aminotransferase [Solirubrobacteraceae bacterium]|nr:DegT/DnrJ/EryC1/StrS family aminotransferase [Solirubrobacteraceae bacterium]